jgi:hypothetical protein
MGNHDPQKNYQPFNQALVDLLATLTNGITLDKAYTNAIKIEGSSGIALYINRLTNDNATIKSHCHLAAAGVEVANEFKGEFLGTSGTMDGVASHFHMSASGTGIVRAVIGVAYLDSGKTLSGADFSTGSWLVGGLFAAAPSGVVNGAGACIVGVYGEPGSCSGATLTAAKYLTSIWGNSARVTVLSSGISSLCLLTNQSGATALNFGVYLLNSSTNAIGAAIGISGKHTSILDFTGATTGITEDNKAAPDKAGTIAIITPAGAVGYINYYDGSPA